MSLATVYRERVGERRSELARTVPVEPAHQFLGPLGDELTEARPYLAGA